MRIVLLSLLGLHFMLISKKIFTAVLSFVYFLSSIVCLHASEANFWQERQRHLEKERKPTTLASLPVGISVDGSDNSRELLRQIPLVRKTLSGLPSDHAPIKNIQLPDSIRPFVESIPLNAGTIKELTINNHQKVAPMVILIQDVHMNLEAQQNIATVLLALNEKASQLSATKPLFVGVEGAFGPFDFQRFQVFDDKQLVKNVADFFLKTNQFAAPSFVGITASSLAVKFVGIDDMTHYRANVEAFKSSQPLKSGMQAEINRAKQILEDQKRTALNTELLKFDEQLRGQQEGTLNFGEYTSYLTRMSERLESKLGINEGRELVLEQFATAYEIEKSLDFNRVEQERTRIVEKLAPKLKKDEVKHLMSEGLAYQAGQISFAHYYRSIKKLIDAHGISLSGTPSFDKYIQYVLLADGIKAEDLILAVQRLETQVLNALCNSRLEKDLMAQSRAFYLLEKLLNFALSPDEWQEYKHIPRRLLPISAKSRSELTVFENFYKEADIRSEKMVASLIVGFNDQRLNRSASVLIAGGFHTPQLTHLLKEKGLSYAVVQPKITTLAGGSGMEYLSIFTREKTPLDKLFEGEKLFLGPDVLATGRPEGKANGATLVALATGTDLKKEVEPVGINAAREGDVIRLDIEGAGQVGVTLNVKDQGAVGDTFEIKDLPPFRLLENAEPAPPTLTTDKTRQNALHFIYKRGWKPTELKILILAGIFEIGQSLSPTFVFAHPNQTIWDYIARFIGQFFIVGASLYLGVQSVYFLIDLYGDIWFLRYAAWPVYILSDMITHILFNLIGWSVGFATLSIMYGQKTVPPPFIPLKIMDPDLFPKLEVERFLENVIHLTEAEARRLAVRELIQNRIIGVKSEIARIIALRVLEFRVSRYLFIKKNRPDLLLPQRVDFEFSYRGYKVGDNLSAPPHGFAFRPNPEWSTFADRWEALLIRTSYFHAEAMGHGKRSQ